ncbi:phosphotransferase [Planococcus versutus]|uniref:Phosphotransferase n=1 Tax=Planococcus versutus TaxID=1302659 RepID=A0A1B1S5N6_9BACL|nr:phosphotransferase [Planococcus versutus]ANU28495.1 phosphotransferase [Planococcus versutus]
MIYRVLEKFNLQPLSINGVEDSFSSVVYKCRLSEDENVYVKIPYTKQKYQRELEAYVILEGSVSIPHMLDFWPGDDRCPGAFLLSELKGKPLTRDASPAVAFQVGVLHANLHSIQLDSDYELTSIKNEFPNWMIFIETQFFSFAKDVKEMIDADLYMRSINKFHDMKSGLPAVDGPSFVHMDFRPANIIVDKEKVTGVIDFESVRFGSIEIDFTKLNRDFLSFNPLLYQAYERGYNSVRPLLDLEVVLPFYQFIDAFNSIGWCRRRGLAKNAQFFDENLALLKKIMQQDNIY